MRSWIFSITTPIFSVTWFFRNHSNRLICISKAFLIIIRVCFSGYFDELKVQKKYKSFAVLYFRNKSGCSSTFLLWCSTQKVIFEVCNDMRASTRWLSNSCLNYFFKCICEGRIASDWNAIRGSQQTDGKIYHHNHHHRHLWFSSSI